ncbi:ribosomal L7Ae/L30e/S12e/Gadd45 family protein [Numidum massiliense]|uniref:ribosomal L7Ae/L30e/S12e/Gadd45 family protein n=1 Tax=Numidum massiliense TaxID=1522315 RepID=UPI0006D543E0|nr:ribosomal L7Ae/L30e/S12e/Gadd45 family protein [Numidum massiliense]
MSYDKVKQATNICVGAKETVKALEELQLCEVVVAKDADAHVTEPIVAMCGRHGVNVAYVDSMKQLGKASNIKVGASTVGIYK